MIYSSVRSRRPVVWSHAIDSCPSHDDVGGFFFDFEPFRTEPRWSAQARTSTLRSLAPTTRR